MAHDNDHDEKPISPDESTHDTGSINETQDIPQREVSPFVNTNPEDESAIPWIIEFRVANGMALLRVQVRETMIVGRGSGRGAPDINFTPFRAQENGVSRRHAMILARKKFLTLRDLESTNGTFINGLRIPPNQDMPLEHGDKIKFGRLETQIMFSIVPPNKMVKADDVDTGVILPLNEGMGEHILVLEDDRDVAMVYQMMLENAGYRVTITSDATEAAAAFIEDTPSAVLLDIVIKDEVTGRTSDGLDVLRILKSRCERMGLNIPFIIVSGINEPGTKRTALDSGAMLYLEKPIRVDELVMRVSEVLADTNDDDIGNTRAY